MSIDEIELYQGTFLGGRNIKLTSKIKDGTSISFKGYHETFKKDVFVKFIPIPWEDEKTIEDEVRALIQFRDRKGIVNVIDAFYDTATDSQLIIITDFINGPALNSLCGLNKISLHRALDIVSEMLYGVSHLHGDGLVHRDLKLENVMLASSAPVIVDLGSVKRKDTKVNHDDPITFLYRSPEVFLELKYSCRSDLYQIGLILYQLINGCLPLEYEEYAKLSKKPFNEETVIEVGKGQVMRAVTKGKLVDIVEPKIIYCPKLARIVNNALQLRYKSVDAFYKEVYKVKNEVPDWLQVNDVSFVCKNWKGKSYTIMLDQDNFRVRSKGLIRSKEVGTFNKIADLNKYFQSVS